MTSVTGLFRSKPARNHFQIYPLTLIRAGGPVFDLARTINTAGCPVLRAVCEGRGPRTHTQRGFSGTYKRL